MSRRMRQRRRLLRILGPGALLLVLCALSAGCGAYVRAPELAPAEPVATVYIADYGRHSSLFLPRDDGTLAEFTFGQWDWYALNRRDWWRAPRVLLLPARSTLGTRDVTMPADADDLARRYGFAAAYEVRVGATEAKALLERLDERWKTYADGRVWNQQAGIAFVPTGEWYWLPYNSNTAVARWLGELGCRVTGLAILSEYRVRPARGWAEPEPPQLPPSGRAGEPPLRVRSVHLP